MPRIAFACLLLAAALGACSSRSAPAPSPRTLPTPTPAPAPTPAPTPTAPPTPQPTAPPPRSLPTPPADTCVTIHTGECVPSPRFQQLVGERAVQYAGDPNFQAQWGLRAMNAHLAYGHVNLLKGPEVEAGAGVTVGVIDSGIDPDHPVFLGKTIHREFLFGAVEETGASGSHGTAVSSIIAGVRTGQTGAPHGVAPGADLAVWAIPLSSPDNTYSPITLETLAESDAGLSGLFETLFDWRDDGRELDILNLSIGYDGIIEHYREADLRENLPKLIATLAQADTADKTILVWAAGNQYGNSCEAGTQDCVNGAVVASSVSILPGLLAYMEELQGHSIAVVALGRDGGAITHFSNHCGVAADHCIAAPGGDIGYAYFGPGSDGEAGFRGYRVGSGTSFSAPMVSGGLAVMKHLFRDQLSNEELVRRLFRTADKRGIYANRAIYGQGRMDLGAATSPVGVLDVPITTGAATTAGTASLGGTGLRLGAAFGDGFGEALDGGELMALDDLGAPFWYDLGGFAATTDGPSMAARMRTFLGPADISGAATPGGGGAGGALGPLGVTGSVLQLPGAAGNGHLALAEGAAVVSAAGRGGLSAAAFTTGRWRPLLPASGAAVAFRPHGFPVAVSAGWIAEPGTMLGSLGQGAFGELSAGTAFLGVRGGGNLGAWSFGAGGEFGVVNPVARGGLIRDISSLATTTFALHASRSFAGRNSVHLSLSQPLRVESGQASLAVPEARTKRGEVRYRSLRADLAPGERQLDLTAQWNRALALGEFRLGAVWSHWPGHREILGPQLALLAGWRWIF